MVRWREASGGRRRRRDGEQGEGSSGGAVVTCPLLFLTLTEWTGRLGSTSGRGVAACDRQTADKSRKQSCFCRENTLAGNTLAVDAGTLAEASRTTMARSRLMACIAEHLLRESRTPSEHTEALEVAAQLVGGTLDGQEVLEQPRHDSSLLEVFIAGEAALSARVATEQPAAAAATSTDLLSRFMGNLQQRGFFAGTEEGSAEYTQRFESARAKFLAKFGDRLAAASAGASPANAPPSITEAAPAASLLPEDAIGDSGAQELLSTAQV